MPIDSIDLVTQKATRIGSIGAGPVVIVAGSSIHGPTEARTHKSRADSSKERTMIRRSKRFLQRRYGCYAGGPQR